MHELQIGGTGVARVLGGVPEPRGNDRQRFRAWHRPPGLAKKLVDSLTAGEAAGRRIRVMKPIGREAPAGATIHKGPWISNLGRAQNGPFTSGWRQGLSL